MSLTVAQARADIINATKAVWDGTGLPLLFDDSVSNPPAGGTSYGRLAIRHHEADLVTLAGAIGTRVFRRYGTIFMQIFTPLGEGLESADALAKLVLDGYEGKSTPGGVWFRQVRYREMGPDGAWFHVQVVAEFEYNEVK